MQSIMARRENWKKCKKKINKNNVNVYFINILKMCSCVDHFKVSRFLLLFLLFLKAEPFLGFSFCGSGTHYCILCVCVQVQYVTGNRCASRSADSSKYVYGLWSAWSSCSLEPRPVLAYCKYLQQYHDDVIFLSFNATGKMQETSLMWTCPPPSSSYSQDWKELMPSKTWHIPSQLCSYLCFTRSWLFYLSILRLGRHGDAVV